MFFRVSLLLASASLALIFGAIARFALTESDQRLAAHLEQNAGTLQTAFEVSAAEVEQRMLALATLVVADPEVKFLLKRGQDAIAAGKSGEATAIRMQLRVRLASQWDYMQREFGLRHLQFVLTPGIVAFLRLHAPERFGDSLRDVRPMVARVHADMAPRSGFEIEHGHAGIGGAVPVVSLDEYGASDELGSLEAAVTLEQPMKRLSAQLGAHFAVLLDRRSLAGTLPSMSPVAAQDGMCCHLDAATGPEAAAWLAAGALPPFGDAPVSALLAWKGRSFQTVRFPLRDYLGTQHPERPPVGSILAWRDVSPLVADQHRERDGIVTAALLGYAAAQALLLLLVGVSRWQWRKQLDAKALALHASEARFKRMFERHRAVMLLIAPDSGEIVDANQAASAFYGYTFPQLRGMTVHDINVPSASSCGFPQNDTDETPPNGEHFILPQRLADGRLRTVEVHSSPIESHGRILLFAIVRDVTEECAARAEIERLSRRNELLLMTAGEGIFGVDADGRTTFINPSALTMLGRRAREVVGHDQHRLFHYVRPDGRPYPHHECPVFRTLTDGHRRTTDEWFIRADGSGFPVAMTVSPVDEDGRRVGAVVVFRDITEDRAVRADLLTTQARLYAVIANLSGGVMVEDDSGRIVLINETFCENFRLGPRPEALLGTERARLAAAMAAELAHPDRFNVRMAELLSRGKASAGEEIAMAGGRTLECDYAPVEAAGRTLGHLWFFRDITERKEKELEMFRLATTDALTGVHNRRYFLEQLAQALSRMHRFREPATLLMTDLDYFKQVNDLHGHAAGDAVLRHFAAIARATLRKIDFIGRLGGEEFALFLPGSDAAGALETAERLRSHLADNPAMTPVGPIQVTVSIGVAQVTDYDLTPDPLLSRADHALYAAKAAGRNRVELFRLPPLPSAHT